MPARVLLRNAVVFLLALVLVNVVSVEAESDESELTVANGTNHYLHIFIENEAFLYVAPRRSVTYTSSATPSMLLEVFYAPGQQIYGSFVDTVTVPFQTSTTACTCQEGETFGECIHEPATGGSARLEILPEYLVTDD